MQGLVELHGLHGRNIDYMQFMKILFNPFALWDFGKLDAIVRGNAQQCPRKLGTSFSTQVYNSTDTPTRWKKQRNNRIFWPQVTNHLFQSDKLTYGLDLFAINVQRGRDHGLGAYYKSRELCNLSPVNDWPDLEKEMRPTSFRVLKQIYQ